ncbi:hypothetical protein C5D30_08630 [Rathayibacter toxicus]|uniref:Uncharacterized protein n=2 Tax=Rathayibacter toxicus TaxID=145458 RepID=A0A2S5Y4W4_9MICO|nr:hypothetical protein TI83_08805 [Rathayibacter toxicus]PPG20567.1 hypothetical protein C5D15_08650 [Rathayibacter toxicus]PPG45669.1 hypothetical protein C5D16_08620 [Rathayibacter toxicus]PPH56048.1 hypothetical protein C5D30_08630 [Rathayibacter toxicus]PPH62251.1 hypothetical protein C5D13_08715 [Rathayibacter toxicus]
MLPLADRNDTNEVFTMPTSHSDVPLGSSPQREGGPVPLLSDARDRELVRLRAQVDSLLNDPFDEWVERIQVGGASRSGFERTLSWRITKPLRLVRTFQIRVQQLGLIGAIGHSARFAKRRLAGRAK